MSLRQDRCTFTRHLATLITWINVSHKKDGWEVAIDEATVHSPRAARRGTERLTVEDAVHKRDSFHHKGLATDLNLYIHGNYVADGDHPAWKEIAHKWKSLDSKCTAGIDFGDANHVSYGEGK